MRSAPIFAVALAAAFFYQPPSGFAETPAEKPPVEPAVEQVEDDLFKVGDITFRPSNREIRFPAEINMQEGLLEYLIVREHGKTHESLLATSILPTNLNIALKLLRYPASPELFTLRDDKGGITDTYPDVPEDVRRGARLEISVAWLDGGEEKTVSINEWISHEPTRQSMPPGPWLYTGSFVTEGGFVADGNGDIAAIFSDAAAMFNYPGKDREDDTVWSVMTPRVPPVGTPVTVILTPYHGPIDPQP